MPPKRKAASKAPHSVHHPSKSSVDVPLRVKEEIKVLQDKRCWLCNFKSSGRRTLEICHIFQQAKGKRFNVLDTILGPHVRWWLTMLQFELHHKWGRTHLDYIHDKANLVALCHICHPAFDNDEWIFLPEDMATWLQSIRAEPGKNFIQEYNPLRNASYRRLLIQPDPESNAFQDKHYKSAFVNEPTKIWAGEVGVVLLRSLTINSIATEQLDEKSQQVLETFDELSKIWRKYRGSCSKENCLICRQKEKWNEEHERIGNQEGEDDGDDNNSKSKEDWDIETEDEEDNREKRKMPRRESSNPVKKYSAPMTRSAARMVRSRTRNYRSKVVKPRKNARKKSTKKQSRKSEPYDATPYNETVPYSHRVGYTWAGTTSNELMTMWQVYRLPLAEAKRLLQSQVKAHNGTLYTPWFWWVQHGVRTRLARPRISGRNCKAPRRILPNAWTKYVPLCYIS